MSNYTCRMCGGPLPVSAESVVECEYCGSLQPVASPDSEKKQNLFVRANRLRIAGEFDRAAAVYESIAAEFPEESEASWGIVLCRYGIEYVDDPATGKKVPTCHRSSYASVLEDADYLQTLDSADPLARRLYHREAAHIEELREDILSVSSREKPYDIFICFKDTNDQGSRTLDSVLAQDLYDLLTDKGYRVFFSRISLEDKLGREYEPYIFAALNSAKVMLAVGTCFEHYDAVWVKNEWSRFLKLMEKDREKYLIPCFKDLDAYDMPKEFRRLQAQDLGKVGAHQDLLRGVEKLIRPSKMASSSPFTPDDRLRTAFRNAKDGNHPYAAGIFQEVLSLDPENADAYLGLLLTDRDGRRKDYLSNFVKYAGDELSDHERSALKNALSHSVLTLYIEMDLCERVLEALTIMGGTINSKTIRALYKRWPQEPRFAALASNDSSRELREGFQVCERDRISGAADHFQKVLDYGIHIADASLGMMLCCSAHDREPHKKNFLRHIGQELSPHEISALNGRHMDTILALYLEMGLKERTAKAMAQLKREPEASTVRSILAQLPDDPYARKLADASMEKSLLSAFHDCAYDHSRDKSRTQLQSILDYMPECESAWLGMALICEEDSRQMYLDKFIENARPEPNPHELQIWRRFRKESDNICMRRLFERMLLCYQEVGFDARVLQALDGFDHPLQTSTVLSLLTGYPDAALAQALIQTGSDLGSREVRYTEDEDRVREEYSLACEAVHSAKQRGTDQTQLALTLLEHIPELSLARTFHFQLEDYEISFLEEAVLIQDNMDLAKALIEHGADVNAPCVYFDYLQHRKKGGYSYKRQNLTLAEAAVMLGKSSCVEQLLQLGGQFSPDRFPVLFLNADTIPDRAVVQALLDHGCDVNHPISRSFERGGGDTAPLLSHLLWMDVPIRFIRLLLECGADPNGLRKTRDGSTYPPLFDAIWHNKNIEYAQLLLEYGADIHAASATQHRKGVYEEISPISYAILSNLEEMAAMLLEHGADPNSKRLYRNSHGDAYISVLSDAVAKAKNPKLVKLLLDHGADPNAKRSVFDHESADTYSALSDSIWNIKNVEIQKLLLDRGADPNAYTERWYYDGRHEKESLLHQAVYHARSFVAFAMLMENGASIDAVTTHDGRDIPFRKYPYEPSGELKTVMRRYGWKGPGLFGR